MHQNIGGVVARGLVCAVCLVGLVSCGTSNSTTSPTPEPSASLPPPVRIVVAEMSLAGLDADLLLPLSIEIEASGTLDASVDWTFPSNDVDMFFVRGFCDIDQINGDTCPYAATAIGTASKPERLSSSVTPGSYTLYIGNRGPTSESIGFQVGFTPAAGATGLRPVVRLSEPIRR